MERLLDLLSGAFFRVLEFIMVLMLIGMLILVGLNVFLRIGFNTGIDFAEEVPRFMFIWLIFCGAVVAMKQNSHISVNMFVHMVGRPVQKLFYALTQTLVIVCGGYITYGTWMLHDIVRLNASPVLQISMLIVYGVTYIAGPALALIALANLIRLALGRVSDQELAETHEDDPEELAARELAKANARTGEIK
jgi:TRAP-type transport system small permease protein